MIKRGWILWVAVFILLGTCATVQAGTKKEECLKYFDKARERITLAIRYKHAEWYLKPAYWYSLPYTEKEALINYISYCRGIIYDGSERVVFFDGMSGEKIGKMGVAGPKVYK